MRREIVTAVSGVDGLLEVDRVRIRRAGNRYFADLSVGLARNVTFQRSEQVADAVADAVHNVLPDADVVVHPVPRAVRTENIFDRVRAVATRHNVNLHDISVQDLNGVLHVEQHLELDERLSLKDAHDRVTVIEAAIRRDVPEVSSILTHIESEPATIESGNEVLRDAELEKKLKTIAGSFCGDFRYARRANQTGTRPPVHLLPLHPVRRIIALPRARYLHRVGNPLQAGSAGVVPGAYPSRGPSTDNRR